jgi:hypothetical protein
MLVKRRWSSHVVAQEAEGCDCRCVTNSDGGFRRGRLEGRSFFLWVAFANVRYWHLADNPAAPEFVRYWTKADNGRFCPGTVGPLMTQSGHPAVCMILPPRRDDEL